MTLPENLDVYISALMFVLGAYFIALYIGLIVWTFRDIRSRSRDLLAQIMATLMVAVFTLPGLLIYLLLRPHVTLSEQYERSLTEEAILQDLNDQRVCPSCQHVVEPDFVVCPYCQTQLRLRCTGCGRLTNLDWSICPYCGLIHQTATDESAEEPEEIEATADALAETSDSFEESPSVSEDSDEWDVDQKSGFVAASVDLVSSLETPSEALVDEAESNEAEDRPAEYA